MKNDFGIYIRSKRESLRQYNSDYSVRKVSARIGVQPCYLSQIETGNLQPPSESCIKALAKELDEDPDVLLAMAGKVSDDLRGIILKRPILFAQLIRELKDMPDNAVLRLVREVKDGSW